MTCFVQDELDFIWIGTKKGLNKYDGFKYKVYSKKNSNIGAEDVADLLLDSKGRLWVATIGGGLNRYDKLNDDFIVYKNNTSDSTSLSSNQVLKIFEDSRQNIFIGTTNGLNQFDEKTSTFKRYEVKDVNAKSNNSSISAIVEDENENLWLGSFGGSLNKLDLNTDKLELYTFSEEDYNLSVDFIYTMQIISNNKLLIGTSGSGLLIFDIGQKELAPFFEKENKLLEEIPVIRTMYKDADDILWVGTDGYGVLRIEGAGSEEIKMSKYLNIPQTQSSLAGNAIYSIFADKEKNLWIGSAWNGISVLESNRNGVEFFYSDFIGKSPEPVLSIFQNEDQLWLGSDGQGFSIFDYNSGEGKSFQSDQKLSVGDNYIQLIKPSKKGSFWIGTFSNGLLLYHPKIGILKHFQNQSEDAQSLSYNDVRDVLEDSLGNLWVATWGGGLCLLDQSTGKFQRFMHSKSDPSSISSNNILSIRDAGNGKIWIATFGGGLNLFDPINKQFRRFQYSESDTNSICSDNVLSILDDQKGNLWIGTWGDGLCRLDVDQENFIRYDEKDRIGDNTITALIKDDEGDIWMSTKKGISKFDKTQNTFLNYPKLEGEYHINSSFKNSAGKIYFGGINGAVAITPDKLKFKLQKPRPQLTGFKLFNKEVKIGEKEVLSKQIIHEEKIVLNYDQTVITFEFAALQYPFSNDCEFAIFLENFDKEWREIGDQRNTTFTNLPPGEYQFQLKTRTKGADWSNEYASIDIQILKPYWATWWAYSLYATVFLLLLYLFQRYSVSWASMKDELKLEQLSREKEVELHQLKQKFFTNISHEIRTPVTLLLGSLNRINQSQFVKKQDKDSLITIKKSGDHLLQLMNELLDIRKLDAEGMQLDLKKINIVEYAKEIFLFFKGRAIQNDIKYHFKSEEKNIQVLIDAMQLEKVINNLLSNAFKFTDEGGSISLSLRKEKEKVFLSVQDTGQGIPMNQLENIFKRFYQTDKPLSSTQKGYGIGLSIVKDIVQLHGGKIEVQSKYGEGSCFIIKLEATEEKEVTMLDQETKAFNGYLPEPEEKTNLELSDSVDVTDTTILIVEDNLEIRNYLDNWLKTKFKILLAENGAEGLKMAKKHIPDLVISDVMMPVMDGISFTKEMKCSMATSHIPIIILTARTSLIYKKEGYETGADEYLTKPFNEELLLIRITGLLKNQEILREKFKLDSIIDPKELIINSPDQQFLQNLMKIIEENIGLEEFNAAMLTRELGMSHSVIYKKIKALTGQSMVHFIRDFRLKRAAQLIEQYGFSVKEACFKVGFSDRRYFSKIFKERFGRSPSSFKEK